MDDCEGQFGNFHASSQITAILAALNIQRQSSKLCDVILKISEEQIHAHSNVLAAASPYFDSLFSGQDLPRVFSQKTPQIIEIHIDGPTDPGYKIAVQRVVDFMYTSHIELDDGLLTHIVEIAKIMQMATIIEFCDLFQQGITSVIQGNTMMKPTCSDGITQTDDLTYDKNEQVYVTKPLRMKLSEVDKEWKYSKNLPRNSNIVIDTPGKRKRGRPRKPITLPNESTSEGNMGETVTQDNILKEIKNEEKESTNINSDNNDTDVDSKQVHIRADVPHRVSKRGRIIKPKKFSDDLFTDIKQELNSDEENYESRDLDLDYSVAGQNPNNTVSPTENEDGITDKETSENQTVDVVVRAVPVKTRHTCDKCEFSCTKIRDYNEHQKEHLHADKKCSYCGWVCDNPDITEEEFQAHLANHTGPEPFFCFFCNVRFKTRTKLFLHLPKHSKTKPFVCEICQAGFKWKHALKNHMIIHKNTKEYLCDICGFSTAHKTQLKAHHLIHTGETFRCPEFGCDYQATKKINLKFHMMTHTREKPHQCEVCGTSFSLLKNMKRHKLLHTNDRPYRCEKCTFCTTRFDKLKEHYFKTHNIGEKPGKKFRLTEYLNIGVNEMCMGNNEQEAELNLHGELETVELQVMEDGQGATTQIVNVLGSSGETVPIAITQVGEDISYEIRYPVDTDIQYVTEGQDIITQEMEEIVAE